MITIDRRSGAYALIAGAIVYVLLMAFHPSHEGGAVLGRFTLNELVHGAALVVLPLWAFGGAAICAWIGGRPAAGLGLSCWWLGVAATLIAATMSGLVTPRAIEFVHGAHNLDPAQASALHVSVWINRGFAHVHYALSSAAILIWSLGLPRGGWGRLAVMGWGIAAGLGVLGWQLSGTLTLNPREALVIVLAHVGWVLLAATAMLLEERPKAEAD